MAFVFEERDKVLFFSRKRGTNEIVKICPGFSSKFALWRTFADPGPPKKAPHGPDQFFRGPRRRLQVARALPRKC